jgi:predicted nucleic acid-binding protein
LSFLSNDFPDGPLVLDASAIFNLLGCKRPADVLSALAVPCLIEERTLAEIKRHPIPGSCHNEVLSPLLSMGQVRIHRMSAREYDTYLGLVDGKPSESLDDGESAAIAVAASLKHAVILDDGKARRIHLSRFPTIPFASSLRLFIVAGTRSGWPTEQLRELVHAARTNARMNVVKGEEALLSSLEL